MKRSPIVNPDEPKKSDDSTESLSDIVKRLRGMTVDISASIEKMRNAMLGMSKPLTKNDVALTSPTTGETNEADTTGHRNKAPDTRVGRGHLPEQPPETSRRHDRRHRR